MQRLPNLGGLDLRQRTKTGTDGGNGGAPNPKRQKTSRRPTTMTDEDRDRQVEAHIRGQILHYFGQMPSDPQVVAAFRQRVVRVIQEMHSGDGLTENWPSQLGLTEGEGLLGGNKKKTNNNIYKLRTDMWSKGIVQMMLERDRDRRESDLQKKARMIQNELRDQDALGWRGVLQRQGARTAGVAGRRRVALVRSEEEGQRWRPEEVGRGLPLAGGEPGPVLLAKLVTVFSHFFYNNNNEPITSTAPELYKTRRNRVP